MLRTFVPQLTEPVVKLCRSIQPAATPLYVPVKPGIGTKAMDCFINVQKKVEAEGGRILYGWAIWQCSQYYLEAEHHAIYEPSSGMQWVDITPPLIPTIDHILFLPDDGAIYDFKAEQLRDNIRLPLTNDSRVREFCELTSERTSILNSVPGFGQITLSGHRAMRMDYIEKRRAALLMELQRDHERKVGRNDPCPCGSGKKYKKCHGNK